MDADDLNCAHPSVRSPLVPISLKQPPKRILLVSLRRIGDVLLSTALIPALARKWPEARIEVLTNASAAVTLQGNPHVAAVVVQAERPRFWQVLSLIVRIFRRYDLAVCAMGNDRPYLYAFAAAPVRVGLMPQGESSTWLKKKIMSAWCVDQPREVHVVEQYLRVGDLLELPRDVGQVMPPQPINTAALNRILGLEKDKKPYAVVHPVAMFRYKAWTTAGWQQLVTALLARGLRVYLTGADTPHEHRIIGEIRSACSGDVHDLAGRLRFAELTPLLERAKIYVGPDTSVTHLAAATGVPTITLFGPSDPVRWGPWPYRHPRTPSSPWVRAAPLQHHGNVWIVQGVKHCVPCLLEGCDRRLDSRSECLEELSPVRVIEVVGTIINKK